MGRTCFDSSQLAAVIFSAIFGTLVLCILFAVLLWWYLFGRGRDGERTGEWGLVGGQRSVEQSNSIPPHLSPEAATPPEPRRRRLLSQLRQEPEGGSG